MTRIVLERDNVNDDFVVVRKIYKHSGDLVAEDEVVLDVETSKTLKEIRSPQQGVLKIELSEGDEVNISAVLFEIGVIDIVQTDSEVISAGTSMPDPIGGDVAVERDQTAERRLSRAASELSAAMQIDAKTLPGGWVTAADVLAIARKGSGPQLAQSAEVPLQESGTSSLRIVLPKAPFRRERISMRKRSEAQNLARANGNGSTSTIGIKVVIASARIVAPIFLFQESITDLVVFEASRLLRQFRDLNGFYLDDRALGLYESVNFGIGFDSGHDLKVLTLRSADTLSLNQVQQGIEELLHLYESGAPIKDELLTTSTVTVTDLSRSAVDFMMPLLNSDQSLILGITRGDEGGFMLWGSFDHRVSEGLQVARFLEELRERIQSHYRESDDDINGSGSKRCSACNRSVQEEIALGRRGLMRMILADGSDGFLCRICFEGW